MYPNMNQSGYPNQQFSQSDSAPYPVGFPNSMPQPDFSCQYPQVPQYPPAPQYPIVSPFPVEPQYPTVPQFPIEPQYPQVPQYPPASQYPTASQYPQQQQYPPASHYPSTPQYPPAAQYPQNPSQPTGGNMYQNVIPSAIYNPQTPNLYPNIPQNEPFRSTGYNSYRATEATVKPHQPFNPNDDAEKLYKAMKGFGTDETALIGVICKRTNQQRLQISSAYKQRYGKDLLLNVLSETSGKFQDVLRACLLPTVEFEAYELNDAIMGIGTDEIALIDIICTKTNAQMMQLKMAFRQLFRKDLEAEIRGDVSGYFKRILVSLINANRSEAPADLNRARQQATELYQAGVKRLGTDEVKFNQIFASESYAQLRLVFEEYYKLTGSDIEKAIRSEMSGDVEMAFLAITQIVKNPAAYFAERLYKAMKGAGTHDRTLIRNIVLRSEIDMVDIKMEFQRKYSKSLESFIKGDCSGDYKRALLCLVGDPHWK